MSGHLHGGHAGLQLHAPFGGRVVNLPAGLRWNDFQKYYRGHPNGSTAERWQEYQQRERQRAEHPLRVTLPGPVTDLPRCRPFPLSASACLSGWLALRRRCCACAMLCRAVPCRAVLCRAVLCCAATAADPPPVLAVLAPACACSHSARRQGRGAESGGGGAARRRGGEAQRRVGCAAPHHPDQAARDRRRGQAVGQKAEQRLQAVDAPRPSAEAPAVGRPNGPGAVSASPLVRLLHRHTQP
eukprot:COSAG02_NODE_1539_length_12040_cov_11.146470_5_plen_242_part_00